MHKLNIYISPLYIMVAFFMIYFGAFDVFCYYLLALWFHEFGHYIVAKRLGYMLNNIDILPNGARFNGDVNYKNNHHKILVTAAGPIFNFIFAINLVAMWWIFPSTYSYTKILVDANIYLGLFNLLPIYPFDGGQILLASIKRSKRNAVYMIMKIISYIFAIVYMSLFIVSIFHVVNFSLLCMAIFIFVTTIDSYNVEYIDSIKNIDLNFDSVIESKSYVVRSDINFIKLTKYFSSNYFVCFYFVDDNFSIIGSMNQIEIMKEIDCGKYFLK